MKEKGHHIEKGYVSQYSKVLRKSKIQHRKVADFCRSPLSKCWANLI